MSRNDTPTHNKKSFWIAITTSLLLIMGWEIFWRSQGRIPDLSDDKHLWAQTRAKVENLDSNGVVIIGSSRALFNLQLPVWQKKTGIKPVQLATAGGNPIPVLEDLVKKTDYRGTIIVGVTPGIFFAKINPDSGNWKRSSKRIKHYYERTYADRLNQFLSIPLQNNLAFITASENEWDNDIDLKALLRNIKCGIRTESDKDPPFNSFQYLDIDRNTRMSPECAFDTTFSNGIKAVWANNRKKAKKAPEGMVVEYVKKLTDPFLKRGGNVIFVRFPSTGMYKELEAKNQPRKDFWDQLLLQTGCRGYHYNDYDSLRNFSCPEWSHLSGEDADKFTSALLDIMLKEKVIPNLNRSHHAF